MVFLVLIAERLIKIVYCFVKATAFSPFKILNTKKMPLLIYHFALGI